MHSSAALMFRPREKRSRSLGTLSPPVPMQQMSSRNNLWRNATSAFKTCRASLARSKGHLGLVIERTPATNDIILGQAARHMIVHNMATVDAKMLKQISTAAPRDLKPDLTLGQKITFTREEIDLLGDRMEEYVGTLAQKLELQFEAE